MKVWTVMKFIKEDDVYLAVKVFDSESKAEEYAGSKTSAQLAKYDYHVDEHEVF